MSVEKEFEKDQGFGYQIIFMEIKKRSNGIMKRKSGWFINR